jgi:anaerobic selenocysteine-containing dehydrogenase
MTPITRREFLRFAALMGGASLFAGCSFFKEPPSVPEYISGAPGVDPLETLAGVQTVYTVCGLCPGNCGISCRVAQGTLVKIGGNPYHPVAVNTAASFSTPLNKATLMDGSVCAIGGSGVQTLYDPFRIARPLKRVGPRGSGKWVGLSWDQAIKEILEGGDLFGEGKILGLKKIKDDGSGLSFLTGRVDWGAGSFLNRFVAAFPGAVLLKDRATLVEEKASAAADMVFGPGSGPIAADYRNARVLISFGDAPVDSGVPLVSTVREISNARVGEHSLQWAVVDPRLSTSASKSDLWVPVIPGKDMELALGIIRSITDRYPALQIPVESLKKQASSRTVAQFADGCGVPATVINRLADMLVQGGKRSAAIPGRGIFSGEKGIETGATILALNAIVGSIPGSGGLSRRNDPYLAEALEKISGRYEYTADGSNVATKAMVLWQTDLVYDDPSTGPAVLKNRSDLPLVVAIDREITETSALADYILPDTSYLERWDVCVPPASVTVPGVGIRRPVVGGMDAKTGQYFPILAENRLMEDILIDLAKKLQLSGFGKSMSAALKPLDTAWDYYSSLFSTLLHAMKEAGFPASPDRDLATVLDHGGLFSSDVKVFAKKSNNAGVQTKYWPDRGPEVMPPKEDELLLISYTLPFHRSPDSGVNSWLLEVLPRNALLINSRDARKLGLNQGDAITIKSSDEKVRVKGKAQIIPGIRPGVVALARGFGYGQAGASRQIIANTVISPDKTRAAGINAASFGSWSGPIRVRVKKA